MKKKTVAKKVTKKAAKSIAKKAASFWNSHQTPVIKEWGTTKPTWPAPFTKDGYEPGYGTQSGDPEKKKEWVLVETISTFRNRYVVEVPPGKLEWACDTVVMNEAKEFSQKYLDETIVSHRVLSGEAEYLQMFDEDNDYLAAWGKERKFEIGLTSDEDLKKIDADNETKRAVKIK